MLFETTAEYDAEIARVQAAIKRSLLVGATSSNRSGVSERSNTEVNMDKLVAYLQQLRMERAMLDDNQGPLMTVGFGW